MTRRSSLFVVLALFVAAVSIAATQFPTIVGSRATLASYTSSASASLSNVLVVESGRVGLWKYNPSSAAAPDKFTVNEPSDNPSTGRWLLQTGWIYGNITYNVEPSGGDFTSLAAAMPALSGYAAAPGTLVTLQLACATQITETSSFRFNNGGAPIVKINGCPVTTHSITSLVSTSGSAGAYSNVLQMGESVSNVTVGDRIAINDASGTNCQQLDGPHVVTATNTGSNQITVNNFTKVASFTATTCTAAAVYDISSGEIFSDSDTVYSGISSLGWSNLIVGNVYILGNGTEVNGLAAQDNGRIFLTGPVVVDDFASGVETSDSASMQNGQTSQAGGLYVTRASTVGIVDNLLAMDDVSPKIVTGSGVGVDVDTGGLFYTSNGDAGSVHFLGEGNSSDCVQVTNGGIFRSYGECADNGGYGINNANGGVVDLFSFTYANNTLGNCNTTPSDCNAMSISQGAMVQLSQVLCWADTNSCISRSSTSNPPEWQSNDGWWFSGGQGFDICGSYTNHGSNTINVCSGGGYYIGDSVIAQAAAPTIASGFGTSPSIVHNAGTAFFEINVGAGASSSAGVITIPAPHGNLESCRVNYDAANASSFVEQTLVTTRSGSSITLTNFPVGGGTATAWPSGDVIDVQCGAD